VFLEGIEYETIWRVVHNWAKIDPDKSDPEALNEFVKARIQLIARAVVKGDLSLRNYNNVPMQDSHWMINMILEYWVFWPLRACYFHNKFNKKILDSHYISRSELFRWCEANYLSFPPFWLDDNSMSRIPDALKDKPASKRDKDKAACRALANLLWHIDPHIAPAHMVESEIFQSLGDVAEYKDDKTIKGWIADLDPFKEKRSHRPRAIEYKVDLKSGGLNEKATSTYEEK
jgi:hypothetical protein